MLPCLGLSGADRDVHGFWHNSGDLCEGISPACGRDAPPDIGRTSKHEAPNSAPGDRPDIKPKFVKQLGTDIHRISNSIGFNSKAAHQLGRGVWAGRHLMCCFGQCKARKQPCVDVCHLGPQSVFSAHKRERNASKQNAAQQAKRAKQADQASKQSKHSKHSKQSKQRKESKQSKK